MQARSVSSCRKLERMNEIWRVSYFFWMNIFIVWYSAQYLLIVHVQYLRLRLLEWSTLLLHWIGALSWVIPNSYSLFCGWALLGRAILTPFGYTYTSSFLCESTLPLCCMKRSFSSLANSRISSPNELLKAQNSTMLKHHKVELFSFPLTSIAMIEIEIFFLTALWKWIPTALKGS